MFRPIVAVTMGDPAGIGPETIIKALLNESIFSVCRPLVVGDVRVLEDICGVCKIFFPLNSVSHPRDGIYKSGVIDVLDLKNVPPASFEYGELSALSAKASFEYIQEASRLALKKDIDAVATAPINKAAMHLASIPMIGHTEMFAALSNVRDPLTMFECRGLRIFFLSRHMSLADAVSYVSRKNVFDYIVRSHGALKALSIENARLAVAALNPHGSDNGLFGSEENIFISPAVADAKDQGIDIYGPIAADSVFHLAKSGKYDAVLSLYHDQGHIAAKTLDFERTVSVTIGLKYIRTSVDHGTAFDIAGKNLASGASMEEAILLAAKYSKDYISTIV